MNDLIDISNILEEGNIETHFVQTKEELVDIFTNTLDEKLFLMILNGLAMMEACYVPKSSKVFFSRYRNHSSSSRLQYASLSILYFYLLLTLNIEVIVHHRSFDLLCIRHFSSTWIFFLPSKKSKKKFFISITFFISKNPKIFSLILSFS